MKRVLIISNTFEEQEKIREVAQYHNPGGLQIETTASFGQDITYWVTQGPDLLIIKLPPDETLQGYFFKKLKQDVPPQQPVIFICPTMSPELMQTSLRFLKVRMLKEPVEGLQIYRALNDLLQTYQPHQTQVRPRYLTDLSIEILSDVKESKWKGTMKNLSMSGAYFEVMEAEVDFAEGDLVKLSALAGDPPKNYLFDARIVWSKRQTSGAMGFGVAFVNKEEVYNHLLKNL